MLYCLAIVDLFGLAIGEPGLLVQRHQSLGYWFEGAEQVLLAHLVAVVVLQQHLHHPVDLEFVVVALGIELGLEIQDQVGIGGLGQFGGGVVGLEGRQDLVGLVHEIHHVGGVLAEMAAVEP